MSAPKYRTLETASMTKEGLGRALMGPQMLVMVVVSPVMVATIVGGVVLAAHRTRYDRFGDALDGRPARDPGRRGGGR